MRRFGFFLLLFLAIAAITNAQSLKGILVDATDNKPLAGATLKLTSLKDETSVFQAVSDSKGAFEFRNLPADSFMLQVSYIGYEEFKQIVGIKDLTIDLGTLSIPKATKQLEVVTVTSRTPPAQQKGDTVQYNASQFKVNPDATVEDLVKKMPGITVERDGTVTAQGEQVRKVTIDGRDFFGDDATAALRNLPAEVVDKIQVFDRLSDQAQFTGVDDGNTQRAINIVTRAGMRNGQFGRVYAGYGTDNRYQAGGNVSFFKENRRISLVGLANNINQQNFASQDLLGLTSGGGGGFRGGFGGGGGGPRGGGGGGFGGWGGGQQNFLVGQQNGISKTNAFGINYTDKWGQKTDVQGSYFFNNSNNVNDRASQSQTLFQGKTQYISQKSVSQTDNYNHRINLRLEHRIDSNNSIIINPSLNFQKNNSLSEAFSRTLSNADTVNKSDNVSESMRNGYNLRNNILYRRSFAKKGRTFSINLNTTLDKNDGESYVKSNYRFFYPWGYTDSLQDQYTINPTNGYSISSNLNYTEPVGKNGQLQFNYSPSFSKYKANQQTFMYDVVGEKYSRFDTTLSNKFDNITKTQNGGITYRYTPNRDDQFAVGLNIQHSKLESERIFPTETQVNQSFTNLLPNLQFRKKLSARSNVRIFYRARTNFPTVTQLQDVVNQSNPLRVSSGNPDLKQSYVHFISGRYVFTNTQKGQSFFANIFAQTAADYISNATFIPSADSVIQQGIVLKANSQLTKPVNLDGYRSFRSFFTYGMPVKFIKSTINLNAGFNYTRLPGLANNVHTVTHNYVYNAGIVVASNINEYVDFNLSYNANFNNAKSTVLTQMNKFVNQMAGGQLNLLTKSGWFLQNDISYQKYTGDGINQDFTLWNAGLGKKFLKNRAGELKLSVFDLLKQNQSIYRTVAENYIEDSQSIVLQRYFMLTFTYNLKNFGNPPAPNQNRMRGEGGMGPRF
jgi:hypothetical protein